MGTDKWEHFFQQGFWAFALARSSQAGKIPDMNEVSVRWGFYQWMEGENSPNVAAFENAYEKMGKTFGVSRKGYFGSWSTGIISHGDMTANEEGYRFYRLLYNAFIKNPSGQPFHFSINDYDISNMNEQNVPNSFTGGIKANDIYDMPF